MYRLNFKDPYNSSLVVENSAINFHLGVISLKSTSSVLMPGLYTTTTWRIWMSQELEEDLKATKETLKSKNISSVEDVLREFNNR